MAPRSIYLALAVAGCAGSAVRATAPTPPTATALPFIEDDYPRARAEALRRNQLLVVEGWAPW